MRKNRWIVRGVAGTIATIGLALAATRPGAAAPPKVVAKAPAPTVAKTEAHALYREGVELQASENSERLEDQKAGAPGRPVWNANYQADQPPAQPGQPEVPTLPRTVVEGQTAPPVAPRPAAQPAPALMRTANDSPFQAALSGTQGYVSDSSTTATIVDTPLINVPGSITVINRDIMNDQGAKTLDDITRNVPNLSQQTNGGNRGEIYLLRGFNLLSNQFRKDGFRDASRAPRDVSNVQRVEVLRGPAGMLYGSGDVAGVLNMITKNPLDTLQHAGGVQMGGWDFYRATVDSTGPVAGNENILYRINMAGQLSDSFRDFVFADRAFIAPALSFVLSDNTVFTVKGEYLDDSRMMDRGIVAINNTLGAVPITRFLGEPNDVNRFQDGQVNAFLDHRFNDDWAFRAGWVTNITSELRENADNRNLIAGNNLTRAFVVQDHTVENDNFFIGNLTGNVDMGFIQHQGVFGTELGYDDFINRSAASNPAVNPYTINVFNPVYGQPRPALPPLAKTYTKAELYGVYFADLISLGDYWKVLAGVRHDNSVRYTRSATGVMTNPEDEATTQRYGVIFQPVPEVLSSYILYSESFNPVAGTTFGGVPFVPEQGQLYEVGFKAQLEQDLAFAVSGFDIYKQNTLVADPVNLGFSVQRGEVQSKGAEAEMFANLTDRWSLLASCGYVDARVNRDTVAANVGQRLVSVPYFSSNVWTRYNFIDNDVRTVGMALGYIHVGNRTGVANGTFHLPQYDRWDLAVYHTMGRWVTQVNIENILDDEYYVGAQNTTNVTPGAPVSAYVTTGITF